MVNVIPCPVSVFPPLPYHLRREDYDMRDAELTLPPLPSPRVICRRAYRIKAWKFLPVNRLLLAREASLR